MRIHIEQNDHNAIESNYLFQYEIDEKYGTWYNFIFDGLDIENGQSIKNFIGQEHYKLFIIRQLKYGQCGSWYELLEEFIDYDFWIDELLDKCKQDVFYTYREHETGPVSWENYAFYCPNPKKLKKELLQLIKNDLRSTKIKRKFDNRINVPPNELKITYPNRRTKIWNYYDSNFPKTLYCISHPTIFGTKQTQNKPFLIESNYDFYPFLDHKINRLLSFANEYEEDINNITFEIPSFDIFFKKLCQKKVLNPSGSVKKTIWIDAHRNYLDDLLINSSFGLEKTTVQFDVGNGASSLDLYWSKDCVKLHNQITEHISYRNSLIEAIFPPTNNDPKKYYYDRMSHFKDYKSFPKSFDNFFSKHNWKISN
tara:strand:+ start:119 stop:1222 length:1104 start_codon:yes stop_codon:yes gene_type:complete